jgi:ferredoxin
LLAWDAVAYALRVDVLVRIVPAGKQVRVPAGTRISDAVRRAGMPLASACGTRGVCGRCGVTVLSGSASVSGETPAESRAKRANRIDPTQRLSCMATVSGDVEISAHYW